MSKKKNKYQKVNNYNIDDENEIKRFILIVVGIVVILFCIYGLTNILNKEETEPIKSVNINYDILSVGTIFNAPYDNYYVLIYDSKSDNASIYSSILDNLKGKDDVKKVYFVDLNNKINGNYYNKDNNGKSNPKATSVSEFNFGELTLLEIKNKKIVSYKENIDEISKLVK